MIKINMDIQQIQSLGNKVIQEAITNPAFKDELLNNSLQALQKVGFDTSKANKDDLDKFFKDNVSVFDSSLQKRTTGGCLVCQIGLSVTVSALVVALIAAGVATGGGIVAAGAAVTAAIASAAAAIGISATLLTTILTGILTFSIGVVTEAICRALNAC